MKPNLTSRAAPRCLLSRRLPRWLRASTLRRHDVVVSPRIDPRRLVRGAVHITGKQALAASRSLLTGPSAATVQIEKAGRWVIFTQADESETLGPRGRFFVYPRSFGAARRCTTIAPHDLQALAIEALGRRRRERWGVTVRPPSIAAPHLTVVALRHAHDGGGNNGARHAALVVNTRTRQLHVRGNAWSIAESLQRLAPAIAPTLSLPNTLVQEAITTWADERPIGETGTQLDLEQAAISAGHDYEIAELRVEEMTRGRKPYDRAEFARLIRARDRSAAAARLLDRYLHPPDRDSARALRQALTPDEATDLVLALTDVIDRAAKRAIDADTYDDEREQLDRWRALAARISEVDRSRPHEADTGEAASRAQTDSPRIRRFLDLSTVHVPEALINQPGGLNAIEGVIAYQDDYGAWLWVPDDIDERLREYDRAPAVADQRAAALESHAAGRRENVIPAELVQLWRHARRHGCDYIRLDADAGEDPQLPTYEWC